jgi:predicted transcriptional regulator
MKTVDYRNAAWDQIQSTLSGKREAVWRALRDDGPATTIELACRTELSILTVRPRVTELCQLGFARLSQASARRREGVYEAIDIDQARMNHAANQERQLPLRFA